MRIMGLGAVVGSVAALCVWGVSERVNGGTKPAATTQNSGSLPTTGKPRAIPPMTLGMNAGVPTVYSSEWAFNDLIKNNADFTDGGNKIPFEVDAGGYLINIGPVHDEITLTVQISKHWREGKYDCVVTPGWSVKMRFNDGSISGSGEKFRLTIPRAIEGSLVSFVLNPERGTTKLDKLSCMPSGQPASLLNPAFIEDMKPFRVVRFMDWMRTNNLEPQTWSNRPLPTDLSVAYRGASVEDMVATANALNSDPWFTLPFDADETYYRNFATYVRDHLAPGHKVYVELSNEVWNDGFKQAKDALERGKKAYPGLDNQKATDYYYADRVRTLMDLWSSVFAARPGSLVRVVAAQSVWAQRADDILSHKDLWRHVDALATAPYFGNPIQDIVESGPARVDKVFARLPGQIEKSVKDGVASKAVADKYNLRFMTYEAGPDVIGFTPDATKDAETIISDPRMYSLYMDFLRKWQAQVGGLLVLYDSVGASTYSHKVYTGQPLAETPKMRALADFAKTLKTGSE